MGQKLGQTIKELRHQAGMSQMALAAKVGVSYQQIQKYEHGRSDLSIRRLIKVAAALDVEPVLLIEGEIGEDARLKVTAAAITPDEGVVLTMYRKLRTKPLKLSFRKLFYTMMDIIEEVPEQ